MDGEVQASTSERSNREIDIAAILEAMKRVNLQTQTQMAGLTAEVHDLNATFNSIC